MIAFEINGMRTRKNRRWYLSLSNGHILNICNVGQLGQKSAVFTITKTSG